MMMKKKQLLKLTGSLTSAMDAIERSKAPGSDEITLLTKCQETALLIGNGLEEKYINSLASSETDDQENASSPSPADSGKNGFSPASDKLSAEEAVHILEDYCEAVFQLAANIAEQGDENRNKKIIKAAQKYISNVANKLRYDISPDRKEIVFLPYKASMWDSLESLWKKADADPETDAYVIPIPYYEKNPDGSFAREFYEADKYPSYVPVTDYRKYDFENRQPDEIYIHNPYDDNNYVTSVHPFFYSKNLKNFTDKLVYVPYFVLHDPENPDDESLQKGYENFCLVPGVLNADKTIVQSENMRRMYINILTRYTGEEDHIHTEKEIREFWEERIDGSGSPKFDKIISLKAEDMDIPAEWQKVINRPDGTKKKIILYNTSISALLQNDEKMLEKIRRAFEIFYENRGDVALLWRPHPLIESTLTSMRPALWEQYKDIRDKYIKEGWGIYDDTPDMDRALIISDAYYGDMSSLVQLYQKTKKPIMIQNPEV